MEHPTNSLRQHDHAIFDLFGRKAQITKGELRDGDGFASKMITDARRRRMELRRLVERVDARGDTFAKHHLV